MKYRDRLKELRDSSLKNCPSTNVCQVNASGASKVIEGSGKVVAVSSGVAVSGIGVSASVADVDLGEVTETCVTGVFT